MATLSKGVCVCNAGFEGDRCDQCSCLNQNNSESCNITNGLPTCTCKTGWTGNGCNIRTCSVDCGPNGECEESDESLFSARGGVFSSFFVKNSNSQIESNCGVTERHNFVQCVGKNTVIDYARLPSWCEIAKCPKNIPKLCANGRCDIDCTWKGGEKLVCPLKIEYRNRQLEYRSQWDQVFKYSYSGNRSKRATEFKCKCINGYSGRVFCTYLLYIFYIFF